MKTLTRKEIAQAQAARHAAWLITLGANRDEAQRGTTYRRLRAIERNFSKVSVAACNGELPYSEVFDCYPALRNAENAAGMAIVKIFGKIPDGFFFNHDPRGYALKISDRVMRETQANAHTDFGGYGILAPDFY